VAFSEPVWFVAAVNAATSSFLAARRHWLASQRRCAGEENAFLIPCAETLSPFVLRFTTDAPDEITVGDTVSRRQRSEHLSAFENRP
jgi:hypothetical protein